MYISISQAEKQENQSNRNIANSLVSLRQVLNSKNAGIIATALHKHELPERTALRFKYAIEWEMLGADKVDFWKRIKELYEAII